MLRLKTAKTNHLACGIFCRCLLQYLSCLGLSFVVKILFMCRLAALMSVSGVVGHGKLQI